MYSRWESWGNLTQTAGRVPILASGWTFCRRLRYLRYLRYFYLPIAALEALPGLILIDATVGR